eukprot:Amastigsp_a842163_35.p3 type:complete len:149 gc:universal Amastigsp_a842163_35:93-539(+)
MENLSGWSTTRSASMSAGALRSLSLGRRSAAPSRSSRLRSALCALSRAASARRSFQGLWTRTSTRRSMFLQGKGWIFRSSSGSRSTRFRPRQRLPISSSRARSTNAWSHGRSATARQRCRTLRPFTGRRPSSWHASALLQASVRSSAR